MSKNAIAVLILVGIVALIGIPATLYLVRQQQDTESQAQQVCTAPPAPANVEIQYPNCGSGQVGSQCNPNEGLCTWNAVTDTVTYSVVVTDVNSNNIVLTQSIPGSTTQLAFPVQQSSTYRCEVSALNSCGANGPTGSAQAVCSIDGLLLSPTPTPTTPFATPTPTVPFQTPTPTLTPSPTIITVLPTDTPAPTDIFSTPTPVPTVPAVGSTETTIMFGIGAAALIIVGSLLFLL